MLRFRDDDKNWVNLRSFAKNLTANGKILAVKTSVERGRVRQIITVRTYGLTYYIVVDNGIVNEIMQEEVNAG